MADELYDKFEQYEWEKDAVFQAGLNKALNLKKVDIDAPEGQELVTKYKYYYFSKKVAKVDSAGFEKWKVRKSSHGDQIQSINESTTEPDLSRPWFQQPAGPRIVQHPQADSDENSKGPSFEEIVELISSGKPVPGIRQIPEVLNPETPSTSSAKQPPRKPWEK